MLGELKVKGKRVEIKRAVSKDEISKNVIDTKPNNGNNGNNREYPSVFVSMKFSYYI